MAKPKAKTADDKADAGQAKPAKQPANITDDERGHLKLAYDELRSAEAAYKDAAKDKKAAQEALANLVAEICEGQGPLFDEPDGEDENDKE